VNRGSAYDGPASPLGGGRNRIAVSGGAVALQIVTAAFFLQAPSTAAAAATVIIASPIEDCETYEWSEREIAPSRIQAMLEDMVEGSEVLVCAKSAGHTVYYQFGPIEYADGISYFVSGVTIESAKLEGSPNKPDKEIIELPISTYMAANSDAREIERSDPRFIQTYFITAGTFKVIESAWRSVLAKGLKSPALTDHGAMDAPTKMCLTDILSKAGDGEDTRIFEISFNEANLGQPPSYRIEFRTETRIWGADFDLAPNSKITVKCE